MGLDTIPDRSNGQAIDQSWFNLIRSVLAGDFVPRNTDGVVTDEAGSLGTALYRWLNLYLSSVYLYNASDKSVALQAPASLPADYTIELPPSLPVSGSKFFFVDSSGVGSLSVGPDDSTIELSGSTLRLKDAGITRAKLAPLGQVVSSSSGAVSLSTGGAGTFQAVTNLSCTITPTGASRGIFIAVISDGSSNSSYIGNGSGDGQFQVRIKRGATVIALTNFAAGNNLPTSIISHHDFGVSGTTPVTYSIEAGGTLVVNYAKLIVFEL